jgi:hypothetical protein
VEDDSFFPGDSSTQLDMGPKTSWKQNHDKIRGPDTFQFFIPTFLRFSIVVDFTLP